MALPWERCLYIDGPTLNLVDNNKRINRLYPVLFYIGDTAVYSYGLMISLGAIAGVSYMVIQGKKDVGLTFDQANTLFLYIFLAAFVGGKFFLFLEDPAEYLHDPKTLLTGRGFVFYGSFLFAVPTMLWYFKRHDLNACKMLDVMAITTCLVHMFGRVGCFLAGCCYGLQTKSGLGIVFYDPLCAAPKNTPLHPTQLYEAFYLFFVIIILLFIRMRRRFYGQIFLFYLILYAMGRSIIEIFRGDEERGFVIEGILSYSQFIAFVIIIATLYVYSRWSKRNEITRLDQPEK